MGSSVRIGRFFGIDVNIHYTWLIIFGLVVWSLAESVFPAARPGWTDITYWQLAVVSAVLFFLSVLIHEFSHSLIARAQGQKVEGITLFVFGGVSSIGGESRRPWDELVMAAAGPATSAGLAGLFWLGATTLATSNEAMSVSFTYLWQINLILAIFNMVPGFPLDGGRVLRAILWRINGDATKSTLIAASVGHVIAYLMMFGGLLIALRGNFISGLWFIFIGWFLNSAAGTSRQEVSQRQALRGLKVSDIMSTDLVSVGPGLSIRDFVNVYVLPHEQRAFPVMVGSSLAGIITVTDLTRAPVDTWDTTTVSQLMTSRERLHVVQSSDEVQTALEQLEDLNQLPVLDSERLVGMLSRSHLIRSIRLRQELGMTGRLQV